PPHADRPAGHRGRAVHQRVGDGPQPRPAVRPAGGLPRDHRAGAVRARGRRHRHRPGRATEPVVAVHLRQAADHQPERPRRQGRPTRYEHSRLAPGRYLVFASIVGGGPMAWKWVTVTPTTTMTVDFTLDPMQVGGLEVGAPLEALGKA